jgi:hypothetical protein
MRRRFGVVAVTISSGYSYTFDRFQLLSGSLKLTRRVQADLSITNEFIYSPVDLSAAQGGIPMGSMIAKQGASAAKRSPRAEDQDVLITRELRATTPRAGASFHDVEPKLFTPTDHLSFGNADGQFR